MTPSPLTLLKLKGIAESQALLESLPSALAVVEVENVSDARARIRAAPPGSFLIAPDLAALLAAEPSSSAAPPEAAAALLHVGEGVGLVDDQGHLTWSDEGLAGLDQDVRERFVERCGHAIERFNRIRTLPPRARRRLSRRYTLVCGDRCFDLAISVAAMDEAEPQRARSVVGVLLDTTARHRLQQKIDAIDAAGSELMRIETGVISRLNMAERLHLLEEKVARFVRELLRFDNFEIRLLDRETRRLELVVAVGLNPLNIGEVIYAKPESNGISGWVATTGRSYICHDVRRDPLYREGLDNAASSLTVPLRLHDEVIGVFNVESNTPHAFNDHDRQFAEIFGRYVAMAMHILDLLVVERYQTNEQVAANVLSELSIPIGEIDERVRRLCANGIGDAAAREELQRVLAATSEIRERVEACMRGPRTIFGAGEAMKTAVPDPRMQGRRVLIADDEPEIRGTVQRLLLQKGCDVTVCANGMETIAAIEASTGQPFDLVISDIRMIDRNGYEIFRAAKAVSEATPVVLMTGFGYDPHHSIIRASQEGLHCLLFKPFKATQLLDVVERAFV